jgi:TonB family protein
MYTVPSYLIKILSHLMCGITLVCSLSGAYANTPNEPIEDPKPLWQLKNPFQKIPQKSAQECKHATEEEGQDLWNYRVEHYKILSKNWTIPDEKNNFRPIVLVTISKSGELKAITLARSSGDQGIDNEALAQIRRVPFNPLPSSYSKDDISFLISYDWMHFALQYPSFREVLKVLDQYNAAGTKWINDINRLALSKWRPNVRNFKQKQEFVIILVAIDTKNGKLLHKVVADSSCNPKLEASALESLNKIESVPPPGISYPVESIVVPIGMQYTVKWPLW